MTSMTSSLPSTARTGRGAAAGVEDAPIRVRIPADLDTPDRIVFGLTLRQLAVVAVFAAPAYLAWQTLTGRVPLPVLAAVTAPLAAVALALAMGRRDGLPLDAWLLAALRHRTRPHRLSPTGQTDTDRTVPAWAPAQTGGGRGGKGGKGGHVGRVAVLQLPVEAISADGVITDQTAHRATGRSGRSGRSAGSVGSSSKAVVLVAVSTITAGLHTPTEQAALLGGYARWLAGLAGPVQVVVSARRIDLGARALRIAETAAGLPHPALAQAAVDHAEHLLDLCEDGDPLARTVTIACTATSTGSGARPGAGAGAGAGRSGPAGAEALRRAERTAAALSGIGSTCRVLDGAEATGVLAAAVDPFGPGDPWPRTPPDQAVTANVTADPGSGDGWWSR